MTEPKAKPRLVPARPQEPEEAAAYMPRLPWRWILLGVLGVGTVMGGYWLKEQRRADMLRADILRVHQQELKQPAERYEALRTKLEGWVLEAAKEAPQAWADERLRVSGLRGGNGLYLRVPAAQADTPEHLAKAASQMGPDAIGSCLGLAPSSARALFDKGEFLRPAWIDDIRGEASVMTLRVKDEMLSRRIDTDLPIVMDLLRSSWFLLVLEQGPSRRDSPVDVFLWDIKRNQQLLRARIQARGALLGARVASAGAPRAEGTRTHDLTGSGATDCSIASQLKALTGIPLAEIESELPGAKPVVTAAPGAAPAGTATETPTIE
jgi:hypothetical protein